jgi:hypothetical protein
MNNMVLCADCAEMLRQAGYEVGETDRYPKEKMCANCCRRSSLLMAYKVRRLIRMDGGCLGG